MGLCSTLGTMKVKVKVAQTCPTLCDPMEYTVQGILQARILEWVAFPFSRGSSQPRDWIQVSRIAGVFFITWATRQVDNEEEEKDSTWGQGGHQPAAQIQWKQKFILRWAQNNLRQAFPTTSPAFKNPRLWEGSVSPTVCWLGFNIISFESQSKLPQLPSSLCQYIQSPTWHLSSPECLTNILESVPELDK